MTLSISFYDGQKYHGPDFNNRDRDFFGNGVVSPSSSQFPLIYPTPTSMTIQVGAGVAWVDGYRIANDETPITLVVPAADPTNPRIDIVQIGHDDINSTYSLIVKQGVAGASPIEPGADQNYVKLYAINVPASATSITSSNVTDRRTLLPLKVDGSQIDLGGSITNTDPAYLAVKNGTYVQAGEGLESTAGENQETLALTPATETSLGGVKIGSGIDVEEDGTININVEPYALPVATSTTLGGVKQGTNVTIGPDGTISVAGTTARTDATQTWSAAQTFSDNVNIDSTGTNNSPSKSINFNYYNGTTLGTSSIYVDSAGGFNLSAALKLSGSLLQVRGLATQSTFGVATGVRSVSDVKLTTNTATNVLVYSSPLAGNYEFKGYLRAAQACNVTIAISYTDAGGAVNQTLYSNQALNAGDRFSILPFFFNAAATGAITVTVTSSVANALFVSAVLEGK